MADVFISYAKADRPLALKLAAMLEAEGWKVWWDTSLAIGDDFRNEIMTELGRARAVVVIWTDASIKSDWVRSEAGRAQADRKLIPVKLEHLTYKDLPPPFDVLHTENVGEEDKIKAAVVAQLAKPAAEPSAVALLTKGFKYEVLTWVGIVGGALTLFTNLGAVLKLADWAKVLVDHWKEWTHAFWAWSFGWLGIHVPPEWTPALSFLLFGSSLTIAQALKFRQNPDPKTLLNSKSFDLISWRPFLCVILIVIGLAPAIAITIILLFISEDLALSYLSTLTLVSMVVTPPIVTILFARERLHAVMVVGLIGAFLIIITLLPLWDTKVFEVISTAVTMSSFLPVVVLSIAPLKPSAAALSS
jgi:hypothetical protein